jgi:serine beta-lactamase-like protein LACTB, mitochondrial
MIIAALAISLGVAIDHAVEAFMKAQGVPGMSVAIAKNGEIVFDRAYGIADVENDVPARADTRYRSGSMGKPMTATAAMELVEKNQLDLDQPVQKYCPAFPQKQWPVTPRHLITHTSGIRHYGGPHDVEEQTSTVHYANVSDALAPFKDDALLFEPGTNYTYSTYGFDVLGCVVEGAAGEPYMQAMQSLVFDRAGMSHTLQDEPSAIIPHRAGGYVRVKGELRRAAQVDMSNRLPAGGFVTTAGDLAFFGASVIDCKLVSCGTRDLMWKETALRNGDTVNYGMGWAIGEDAAGKVTGEISHGGSTPGASGLLYLLPQERLVVAFVTNLEDAPKRAETAQAIANIMRAHDKQVPARTGRGGDAPARSGGDGSHRPAHRITAAAASQQR